MASPASDRFTCTLGGAIARGRRRLERGLAALALLLVGVAVAALAYRRVGAAVAALLAAAGPLLARGLLRGSAPALLEVGAGVLAVVTPTGRVELGAIAGLSGHRLLPAEIAHLERLATLGGVTAGTGSFDSHLLGELDLHATDLANAVLLSGAERSVIVTPDEPDRLLAALGPARAEP